MALVCFVSGSVWGQTTVTQTTFTAVSATSLNGDTNVSYTTAQGGGTTAPAINNGVIRLYQNASGQGGGTITISVADNYELNSVTIGSSMTTKIAYTIDKETTKSSTSDLKANETYTVPDITASSVTFYCMGTSSSSRLYVNHLSVTYSPKSGGLEIPTFEFNGEASYTVTLGETVTPPTLNYNGSEDLSGLTISYSSSNENVATVNQTGIITLLEGGKTIITASVAETATHTAAKATYELTVIDPNKQTIILDFANEDWGFPTDYGEGTATYNNMTCSFNDGKKATNTNYFIFRTNGYLILPIFTDKIVTSINLTTSSGIGGTAAVALYANDNEAIASTSIGEKNKTFTFEIKPEFQGSNIAYKFVATTGNTQVTKIEIICKKEEPKSTIDEATGAMTLTGAWTAEAVKALEIPANVTSVDMTAINIDVLPTTIGNPNCLFYVKENSTLEDFNVIAGNSAIIGIELQDGYDFYNTKSFTGDITYSRTFASGWNTFALPFNTAIPNGVQVEAFDKKDGNQILFTEATSIEANTAYLINVQVGGEISFTANNVTVPVTATTGDTYKSNFLHMTGDDIAGKYILVMEEGVEVFARANAEAQMHAFRGYLDLPAASGVQYSISHDGGATGINNTDIEGIKIYSINGTLIINADKTQSVQIYGLDGRMVKNIQVSEGENTVTGLAKGIYLINNQKAIIK